MLTFYGSKTKGPVSIEPDATTLPSHISWIDAFDPTPDERSRLAKLMDVRIPTLDDLNEIESSSRLSAADDALMMSVPATTKDEIGYPTTTPIGFVVKPDRVATIRFARLPSFEALSHQICERGDLPAGGIGATVMLLEIVTDHIADLLERIGEELDKMSRSIFSSTLVNGKSGSRRDAGHLLTRLLKNIGRHGDLVSKVAETLLGLSRLAPFMISKAPQLAPPDLSPELKSRIETVSADLRSLHEFQEQLSNKTQFLLDTLLGLANIEQNNVFRVLTVVSVIGIPPTFVASMYGMNFKNMPELEWHYGYAWGLCLIALSAIVPAVWFKIKGWW